MLLSPVLALVLIELLGMAFAANYPNPRNIATQPFLLPRDLEGEIWLRNGKADDTHGLHQRNVINSLKKRAAQHDGAYISGLMNMNRRRGKGRSLFKSCFGCLGKVSASPPESHWDTSEAAGNQIRPGTRPDYQQATGNNNQRASNGIDNNQQEH